jgi:hypothetical protein
MLDAQLTNSLLLFLVAGFGVGLMLLGNRRRRRP